MYQATGTELAMIVSEQAVDAARAILAEFQRQEAWYYGFSDSLPSALALAIGDAEDHLTAALLAAAGAHDAFWREYDANTLAFEQEWLEDHYLWQEAAGRVLAPASA